MDQWNGSLNPKVNLCIYGQLTCDFQVSLDVQKNMSIYTAM